MPTKTKGILTVWSTFGALWLAVILPFTISCASTTHAKLPIGTVDVPPLGRQAVLKGTASFVGWAIGEDGISDVGIYVDRVYATSAQCGLGRPDVAAAFPGEPDARTAGWQALFDSSEITAGTHELVVQATAKNGAKRDIGVFQILVTK
jgi:hypothetical protein